MPSTKTITPLLGGGYYHIFNRGINRQLLFFQERNYFHFLELLKKYVAEYADILAYCLLPNHFHLVIKIKDVIFLKDDILNRKDYISVLKGEDEIGKFVSNQFRKMFVAYTMAINKQECRTGNLFDRSFKRLEITEHEYLQYVIFYSHYNPEKHGITTNFKNFRFSSYSAFLSIKNTSISRDLVFEIFDGKAGFINYHNIMHEERENLQLE